MRYRAAVLNDTYSLSSPSATDTFERTRWGASRVKEKGFIAFLKATCREGTEMLFSTSAAV